MSNTLTPYPTDLNEAATILLAHVEGQSQGIAETAHACYQIIGVGLGTALPDAGITPKSGTQSCPPCPDGPCPCPCPCPCKGDQVKALKSCLAKKGAISDWLKTAAGKEVLQTAISVLLSLLGSL